MPEYPPIGSKPSFPQCFPWLIVGPSQCVGFQPAFVPFAPSSLAALISLILMSIGHGGDGASQRPLGPAKPNCTSSRGSRWRLAAIAYLWGTAEGNELPEGEARNAPSTTAWHCAGGAEGLEMRGNGCNEIDPKFHQFWQKSSRPFI